MAQFFFLFMQLFLIILSEIANSVDPDQTAPLEQSDLGLHCLHMYFVSDLEVQNFNTFTIPFFFHDTFHM